MEQRPSLRIIRGTTTMLENLCTRKVQSSRGGYSRGVQEIMYLAG